MNHVEIYTDGACKGNPGPGGWGVLLRAGNGQEKELFGGERETTNNRMELMAVIQALQALKRPCAISLYLDSEYVRKGSRCRTPICGRRSMRWCTVARIASSGTGSRAMPVTPTMNAPTPWPIVGWSKPCRRDLSDV